MKKILTQEEYQSIRTILDCDGFLLAAFHKDKNNDFFTLFGINGLKMQEKLFDMTFTLAKINGVEMTCRNCGKLELNIQAKK